MDGIVMWLSGKVVEIWRFRMVWSVTFSSYSSMWKHGRGGGGGWLGLHGRTCTLMCGINMAISINVCECLMTMIIYMYSIYDELTQEDEIILMMMQ